MRILLACTLALVTCLSATAAPPAAPELVGTWELVSVDNLLSDGRRIQPYGRHPVGRLTLDAGGRYSVLIFRPDRPRFAANDKNRGTEEENRALVVGTNSHFGRFEVDSVRPVVIFRIDHASFPNWEGTEQVREFALINGELTYTVRTTTTGGSEIGEVRWRRLSDATGLAH